MLPLVILGGALYYLSRPNRNPDWITVGGKHRPLRAGDGRSGDPTPYDPARVGETGTARATRTAASPGFEAPEQSHQPSLTRDQRRAAEEYGMWEWHLRRAMKAQGEARARVDELKREHQAMLADAKRERRPLEARVPTLREAVENATTDAQVAKARRDRARIEEKLDAIRERLTKHDALVTAAVAELAELTTNHDRVNRDTGDAWRKLRESFEGDRIPDELDDAVQAIIEKEATRQ